MASGHRTMAHRHRTIVPSGCRLNCNVPGLTLCRKQKLRRIQSARSVSIARDEQPLSAACPDVFGVRRGLCEWALVIGRVHDAHQHRSDFKVYYRPLQIWASVDTPAEQVAAINAFVKDESKKIAGSGCPSGDAFLAIVHSGVPDGNVCSRVGTPSVSFVDTRRKVLPLLTPPPFQPAASWDCDWGRGRVSPPGVRVPRRFHCRLIFSLSLQ